MDRRIVEVALFFLREIRTAQDTWNPSLSPGIKEAPTPPQQQTPHPTTTNPRRHDTKEDLAVLLLSNDFAQVSLSRSHGLPACTTVDLCRMNGVIEGVLATPAGDGSVELTASHARALLHNVATQGGWGEVGGVKWVG